MFGVPFASSGFFSAVGKPNIPLDYVFDELNKDELPPLRKGDFCYSLILAFPSYSFNICGCLLNIALTFSAADLLWDPNRDVPELEAENIPANGFADWTEFALKILGYLDISFFLGPSTVSFFLTK